MRLSIRIAWLLAICLPTLAWGCNDPMGGELGTRLDTQASALRPSKSGYPVSGQVRLPAGSGIGPQTLAALGPFGKATVAPSGDFEVALTSDTETALVPLLNAAGTVVLMGVSDGKHITADAQSSALALVLLNPYLMGIRAAERAATISEIRGETAFGTLTSAVETAILTDPATPFEPVKHRALYERAIDVGIDHLRKDRGLCTKSLKASRATPGKPGAVSAHLALPHLDSNKSVWSLDIPRFLRWGLQVTDLDTGAPVQASLTPLRVDPREFERTWPPISTTGDLALTIPLPGDGRYRARLTRGLANQADLDHASGVALYNATLASRASLANWWSIQRLLLSWPLPQLPHPDPSPLALDLKGFPKLADAIDRYDAVDVAASFWELLLDNPKPIGRWVVDDFSGGATVPISDPVSDGAAFANHLWALGDMARNVATVLDSKPIANEQLPLIHDVIAAPKEPLDLQVEVQGGKLRSWSAADTDNPDVKGIAVRPHGAVDTSGGRNSLSVSTTVYTRAGVPIAALGPGNFEIEETIVGTGSSGIVEVLEVSHLEETGTAVHAVLVIDRSGSMSTSVGAGTRLTRAREAADAFVRNMSCNDQGALVSFNHLETVDQPLTPKIDLLTAAISSLTPSGSTAIYDAVVKAAPLFGGVTGGRAMLLLTDGEDNSSKNTLDACIDRARKFSVPVYTIGVGLSGTPAEANLMRIANDSGAGVAGTGYFYLPDTGEVDAIYSHIALRLARSFLVRWASKGP